jgi:hypothetical protein
MEGSRCALLAVAIVTSAALVTLQTSTPAKPDSNHGDSVTDGSPNENPQSGDTWDFNRLEREAEKSWTGF